MDDEPVLPPQPQINTSFFIVSDTYHPDIAPKPWLQPEPWPPLSVDVVIHCGDLTEDDDELEELRVLMRLLENIHAPLKLIVAGSRFERADGSPGEARELLQEARSRGFTFLTEGTHHFVLRNGASLKIYASPHTLSPSEWIYQDELQDNGLDWQDDHEFLIEQGTDVVVTHWPPRGILDEGGEVLAAGSANLFAAVARVRPKLHCFGRVHDGWGAKLVSWRAGTDDEPCAATDVSQKSVLIEDQTTLQCSYRDTDEESETKYQRQCRYTDKGCRETSYYAEDGEARRTLFVNASIVRADSTYERDLPWLVETGLARASGQRDEQHTERKRKERSDSSGPDLGSSSGPANKRRSTSAESIQG